MLYTFFLQWAQLVGHQGHCSYFDEWVGDDEKSGDDDEDENEEQVDDDHGDHSMMVAIVLIF